MRDIKYYGDETLLQMGSSEAKIKLKNKANCSKKKNMRVESADAFDEVQLPKEKGSQSAWPGHRGVPD